jgi:hypothetical protein
VDQVDCGEGGGSAHPEVTRLKQGTDCTGGEGWAHPVTDQQSSYRLDQQAVGLRTEDRAKASHVQRWTQAPAILPALAPWLVAGS